MIDEALDPPAVFDPEVLIGLTGHPDDHALACVLVRSYRRLLPERVRRITATLASDDPDEALDAVLSLKVASATVGAHELADLGGRLERLLRRGDLSAALLAQTELPAAAARADRALGSFPDVTAREGQSASSIR